MGLERCRDLSVQLLPPTPEQCAMRCILQQGVFEQECCLGRYAALKDKTSLDQPRHSLPQLRFSALGHYGQQFVRELSSDSRTHLRDLLGRRAKPIEPRHERGMERCWNR